MDSEKFAGTGLTGFQEPVMIETIFEKLEIRRMNGKELSTLEKAKLEPAEG